MTDHDSDECLRSRQHPSDRTRINAVERAYALLSARTDLFSCRRGVKLRQCGEILEIRGRVPTYYLKQVVQELLKTLTCIERIDNQLLVASSEEECEYRTFGN